MMQTILVSVSVTSTLINHPDMQCSGERILVQFQGVTHRARESRQLEAAGHVEFTTRRKRVVNVTARLTLSFIQPGISAQGMVPPRMDKTPQFNQPYQKSPTDM